MVKSTRLLLILPLSIAFLGVLLTSMHGPYYFGDNLDPDYCYLLNGLNLLTFHVPGHTDHPGTTLQVLGAIVIFFRWMLTGICGRWQPLAETVIGDPEGYLLSINLFLNLLIGAALYVAALRLYRVTGSLWPSLVFQLSIFPFLQVFVALTQVRPEPLMIAAGIGMAVPLIPVVLQKCSMEQLHKSAMLAGIAFGFGLVTKVTFLPWILVVLLLAGRSAKLRFLAASAVSIAVLLIPIYPRMGYTCHWLVSLLTHKGHYGTGGTGVPEMATFLANVKEEYHVEPLLFVFCFLYLCLAILSIYSSRLVPLRRLLSVGAAAIGLQILMVAKHPGQHYIVPILTLPALINGAIIHFLLRPDDELRTKWLLRFATIAVMAVSIAYCGSRMGVWINYERSYVEDVRKLLAEQKALTGCEVIGMYRSSLVEYALSFANDFSAGAQAGVVREVYPGLTTLNVFIGELLSPGGEDRLAHVKSALRQGQCVILQGTPLNESAINAMPGIEASKVVSGEKEAVYLLKLGAAAGEAPVPNVTFPSGTVLREAEDGVTGNLVTDNVYYGRGIGVLTSPVWPGVAEFKVRVSGSGTYDIYIRYASATPRPISLSVNGKTITGTACSDPTGGYFPENQLWQHVATTTLAAGENTIRLERNGPFPHVDKLAFVPATQ